MPPALLKAFWEQGGEGGVNILTCLEELLRVLHAIVDKDAEVLQQRPTWLQECAADPALAAVLQASDLQELTDFKSLLEHFGTVVIQDVAYMQGELLPSSHWLYQQPFFAGQEFKDFAGN